MKFLVLGSSGQLGQSLVKVKPEEVDLILTPDLDITNFQNVKVCIDKHMPDAVINCAAYTAVDKAEEEFQKSLEVNAYAVANIAQITKERDIPFIHISTDYVFDGNVPATTITKRNPLNVYGYTKMIGEDIAKGLNPDTLIIRTASVYSEFGKNFLKTLLEKYQAGQKEFDVVCDHFSCPTYAPDLAYSIYRLLYFKVKGCTIHYAGNDYISWDNFAKKIFKEVDTDVKINPVLASHYNSKATRPAKSLLVVDEFMIGSDLDKGIKETMNVLLNKERK